MFLYYNIVCRVIGNYTGRQLLISRVYYTHRVINLFIEGDNFLYIETIIYTKTHMTRVGRYYIILTEYNVFADEEKYYT